jgi:pimeloyl-ACP methyl ester carboxylesterase
MRGIQYAVSSMLNAVPFTAVGDYRIARFRMTERDARSHSFTAFCAGNDDAEMSGFRDHYVTAQDGLRLHVREYGDRSAPRTPVVCLPGLARTAADFEPLAAALANDVRGPRRVLALDYRGRGLSDYDPDPRNYSIAVELADVLAVLTACGVERSIVIGTSRGGLLTMALAAARPAAIAAAVLNDIGPVIEPEGLMRIKGYVGKLPQPRSFDEGADILRRLFGTQFPKLAEADWRAAAARMWRETGGRLTTTYDPQLARTLDGVDPERPPPPLWAQFDTLKAVPLMVIRGENSDLLSRATVAEMRARRQHTTVIEVADQGHAPLLADPETIGRIASFIAECGADGRSSATLTASAP